MPTPAWCRRPSDADARPGCRISRQQSARAKRVLVNGPRRAVAEGRGRRWCVLALGSVGFDLARSPGLVEEWREGVVETEDGEEALAWGGLDPVVGFPAGAVGPR